MLPGDGFGGGFFGGMPPFFSLIFMLFFIVFAFVIISNISNYAKNSKAPVITTEAKIITKRIDVSNHTHNHNDHHTHHTSTTYYITFQTEHGERLELSLSGRMYGQLIEGDIGELTYQGEWFKDFKRKPVESFSSEKEDKKDNSHDYKEY
ncbi:DUF2500 domain-containing protein [Clostridium sp. MSJ-11]|uniref:DUF2500 domain-containing protein n=1 Tax=Clostridium mobile TaxID=2841512 RepID=A0ABS6EEM3_9CLOT|nr:DUF2500 domain-containing protein [Clostridium mobile]MBU5483675.1 DUF2500 domain-containing protein [Clostridium mobile]